MISRRTLLGAGGGALGAGAVAAIAMTGVSNHAAQPHLDAAPAFSVEALDGRGRYRLADFAGQVLLLNFWATWCAPCRLEMPWLARTYDRHHSQGLAILGVNMDDGDMPAVQRFAREMGVAYPLARNNEAIVATYGGVRFLPQSFLIARNGDLLQRSFGMPSTKELEAEIMGALSRG